MVVLSKVGRGVHKKELFRGKRKGRHLWSSVSACVVLGDGGGGWDSRKQNPPEAVGGVVMG